MKKTFSARIVPKTCLIALCFLLTMALTASHVMAAKVKEAPKKDAPKPDEYEEVWTKTTILCIWKSVLGTAVF